MDSRQLHELSSRVFTAFSNFLAAEELSKWTSVLDIACASLRYQLGADGLGLRPEDPSRVSMALRNLLAAEESIKLTSVLDLAWETLRYQQEDGGLRLRSEDPESIHPVARDRLTEILEHLKNLPAIVTGERPPAENMPELLDELQDDASSCSSPSGSTDAVPPEVPGPESPEPPFHEVEFRVEMVKEYINAMQSLANRVREYYLRNPN
jgi:hypothetical protein